MSAKFEIKKAKDNEFYFHLKAGNGEIILSSEMYKAKASAVHGIESIKKNAGVDAHYESLTDKAGHFRFHLKAANHEIIGVSQGYKSEESRDHGIAVVKADAAGAEVVDLTD